MKKKKQTLRPSKSDLLKELEAIHESLLDSRPTQSGKANAKSKEKIARVSNAAPSKSTSFKTSPSNTTHSNTIHSNTIPSNPRKVKGSRTVNKQSSLFDEPTDEYAEDINSDAMLEESNETSNKDLHPTRSDDSQQNQMQQTENPFLPGHIRKRLSQHKDEVIDELAQVSEDLNQNKKLAHDLCIHG